jgi:hypothetical protein
MKIPQIVKNVDWAPKRSMSVAKMSDNTAHFASLMSCLSTCLRMMSDSPKLMITSLPELSGFFALFSKRLKSSAWHGHEFSSDRQRFTAMLRTKHWGVGLQKLCHELPGPSLSFALFSKRLTSSAKQRQRISTQQKHAHLFYIESRKTSRERE